MQYKKTYLPIFTKLSVMSIMSPAIYDLKKTLKLLVKSNSIYREKKNLRLDLENASIEICKQFKLNVGLLTIIYIEAW